MYACHQPSLSRHFLSWAIWTIDRFLKRTYSVTLTWLLTGLYDWRRRTVSNWSPCYCMRPMYSSIVGTARVHSDGSLRKTLGSLSTTSYISSYFLKSYKNSVKNIIIKIELEVYQWRCWSLTYKLSAIFIFRIGIENLFNFSYLSSDPFQGLYTNDFFLLSIWHIQNEARITDPRT